MRQKGLPATGSVPFRPKYKKNRKGKLLIETRSPNKGKWRSKKGNVDKDEVSARNMREGTLSRIVDALGSRQSRSTQVPLGQQAGGLLVLDATSERVCIELRSRRDNGDDHIAARVILTDEEVKALHDEARRAANAYDE